MFLFRLDFYFQSFYFFQETFTRSYFPMFISYLFLFKFFYFEMNSQIILFIAKSNYTEPR